MNALEIIQAACSDIGITRPTVALAATDAGTQQLVGLLNKAGSKLRDHHAWQNLTREHTMVSLAAESQGSIAASIAAAGRPAYSRITNESLWNRTLGQPVVGPVDAPTWQGYKALSFTGPFSEFRVRGGELLMLPVPAAGNTLAFEYITTMWLTDVTGVTYRNGITADTDAMLLDDELLLLSLIWRWKKAKGFEYAEDLAEYELQLASRVAFDTPKRRLSLMAGSGMDMSRAQTTIPRLIGS